MNLDAKQIGLTLIAVEEMIMQLEEADDTEIQSYGFDASTRDGALDDYTAIVVELKLRLELATMEEEQ